MTTELLACPRCGRPVSVPVPRLPDHRCRCGNPTDAILPETPDPFAWPGDCHQRTA
jgi:hypothetical protein